MNQQCNDFPKRIASKFIDSSNSGEIFLKESKDIIRLGIFAMTTLIIFINIIYALNHGIMLAIIMLFISLIPYSVGLFILLKIAPIYAKFIQRKKIELYIKKCLVKNMSRICISFYKFRLFTSSRTDDKLFSTILNATRVTQIENVFIEIYRPTFSKGGISLVINIMNPADSSTDLQEVLTSLKKRSIPIEYQP